MIKCAVVVLVGMPLLLLCTKTAECQEPSVESVVSAAERALVECDSQVYEMTFVTKVYERELRDDGTIKKEKTYRLRHFVKDRKSREVLDSMWVNGEPVAPEDLAAEQSKREKERLHSLAAALKRDEPGNGEITPSLSMLLPFMSNHRANYEFPDMIADTIDGVPCWRIAVNPLTDNDRLVKGWLWVEQDNYRAVLEEYDIANPPGPAKASKLRLEHVPLLEHCAVPRHIRVRGKGKAFLIIAFNFEVEMFLDSVRVNSGLSDSLFALPAGE